MSFKEFGPIESKNATISASSKTGVWKDSRTSLGGLARAAGLYSTYPSHHQGIEGQPDGRQVLPLRRPASRSFLPGKIYRVPSAATFACAAVQIAFTLSGSFSPNFNIFE